jgi:hypothetical protein
MRAAPSRRGELPLKKVNSEAAPEVPEGSEETTIASGFAPQINRKISEKCRHFS